MDTTFKKYWADLRKEVISTWRRLSRAEIDQIDGDMGKLEDLLVKKIQAQPLGGQKTVGTAGRAL